MNERGSPGDGTGQACSVRTRWIPAFAGVTVSVQLCRSRTRWIPAVRQDDGIGQACHSRTRASTPGMAASIAASVSSKPDAAPYHGSGTPDPGGASGSKSVSRARLSACGGEPLQP